MRVPRFILVACVAWLHLSTTAVAAQTRSTRSGDEILARASRAYTGAPALFASARYVVHIPGAPLHEESQDFGWNPAVAAWIHMPSYVMQVHDDRLYLVEEGAIEPHTEASLAAGLQAAIDSAFGGQGPPLAPAPMLLAWADGPEARRDAFRMKLLGPLRAAGVRSVAGPAGTLCDEVNLVAANGSARARFDRERGFAIGASLLFVPAPGADTIRAEVSYTYHSTAPPPMLPRDRLQGGRRVTGLGALSGNARSAPEALDPGPRFFSYDGSRVGLSSLDARLVVLEFWATWCAPCRVAIPGLAKFARWAQDSAFGVEVVLVNTEEPHADFDSLRTRVRGYLDRLAVHIPGWIDSGGVVHRSLGGGLPLTLVVEPSGRVIEVHSGYHADLADTLVRHVRTHLLLSP